MLFAFFIFSSELRFRAPQAQKPAASSPEGLCRRSKVDLTAILVAVDSSKHPHTQPLGSHSQVGSKHPGGRIFGMLWRVMHWWRLSRSLILRGSTLSSFSFCNALSILQGQKHCQHRSFDTGSMNVLIVCGPSSTSQQFCADALPLEPLAHRGVPETR